MQRRVIMLLLAGLMIFNLCVVAVADDSKGSDHIKWSTLRGKETENLNSVAYGSGCFVAVGSGGVIQVPEDGAEWRKIKWDNSMELHQVTYNGELFVAVGDKIIVKSADGLKWEKVLELQGEADFGYGYHPRFLNILWNGDSFYAFGQGRFYSSPDGTEWKQCYDADASYSVGGFNGTTIDSLAFSEDKAVALAIVDNFRVILTSEDGSTWVKRNAPNIAYPSRPRVYYNGKSFIVPGIDALIHSEDGTKWSIESQKPPCTFIWIKNIDGTYYGSDGSSLYKSTYGFTWEDTGLTTSRITINDIAWDGRETFVVTGDNGLVLTCGKDSLWNKADIDTYYTTNSAATDGNFMAAVGDYGQILVTGDGVKWDKIKPITDNSLRYVVYYEKRFVAVGEAGEILVSHDGYQWHKAENPATGTIRAIAYGAGRFAAVGDGGVMIVSEDGDKWKQVELDMLQDMGDYSVSYNGDSISGIVYNGKSFIAVSTGFTFRSSDGLSWERLSTNTFYTPMHTVDGFRAYEQGHSLLWDGNKVLLWTGGVLAQTDNGEKWAYISEAPYWSKPLFYENGLYFSDIYCSSDAVSWEPAADGLNPGEIHSVIVFKGKVYAFGIKGMLLKGEVLARPEPADLRFIWTASPTSPPKALEGIKQVARNGYLCLPADIIGNLSESKLKVGSNGSYSLSKNGTNIDFKAGSSTIHINGKSEKLPSACYMAGKRLMVPAAYVFDKLGIRLEYNNISKIMTLHPKAVEN